MLFEKQQYQQDCVDNIVAALDGVDVANAGFRQTLANNLGKLKQQDIKIKNFPTVDKPRLDVLMETGTGKTFVYLQTILELNKRYGHTKFVIVLPRAAIKQGVIQNIKLTDSYFYQLYNQRLKYINFPQEGLARVHQDFIEEDGLCVLITTNAAFNSDKNNVNKTEDSLFKNTNRWYSKTWEGIAQRKPIVIIDEPHLLTGERTQKGLGELEQSLFIRFGATFPKAKKYQLGNVVYSLNSIDAFKQNLVKGIGVSTIYADGQQSDVAITNVSAHEKRFDFCHSKKGRPRRTTIRKGEDIGAKSGMAEYNGAVVTKIEGENIYFLKNGKEQVIETKASYTLGENEIRLMLRAAINRHFVKEENLFAQGIKALTLSFIPSVADFRGDSPRVKKIFEDEYKKIRRRFYKETKSAKYRAYLDRDFSAERKLLVHEGYFSGDRVRENKKENEKEIQNAVDAILNDKGKLLSLDAPLRFVFSVWALQEGWDNPNIFTICKLAASGQETTRRQQVGRGLRLAVNQAGQRMTRSHLRENRKKFDEINTVDVIVPAQEQTFIHEIQNEINAASAVEVGDVVTWQDMQRVIQDDGETAIVYSTLIQNNVIDKSGRVLNAVYDFLVNNRDKITNIDDERYWEICEMFNPENTVKVRDNNAKIEMVKIRKQQWEKFKQLWEEINREPEIVYREINEDNLIKEIAEQFNREPVAKVVAHVVRKVYNPQENTIEVDDEDEDSLHVAERAKFAGMGKIAVDFVREEQKELPIKFVCKLFERLNQESFENDEVKAKKILREAIEENIHKNVLQQVDYEFARTEIYPNYPNALQDAEGNSVEKLEYTKLGDFIADGKTSPHFLYDRIVYSSEIEKENIQAAPRKFKGGEITVYAKLPEINIPTPYKSYSPDFAYLINWPGQKTLYLVVETKGYDSEAGIPADQMKKMQYGKKFFESLNAALRKHDVEVRYVPQINKMKFHQLLSLVYKGKKQ